MAEVILDNINKRFRPSKGRESFAVDKLSLHVHQGELLAIVGPSGCGKTTTLRLIAGLEKPDSGTIRIGERVVNDVQPRDRDVAMVFQDFALYPHLSAYENIAFGLRTRKMPGEKIETSVRHAAALLGIADLLKRKPGELSGGERQRVALAKVIVRSPACMLLDEPLNNLDAPLRKRLRREIKTLHEELRMTMIFVTHDLDEAMALGDRIAVMHHGSILQVGTPAEVRQNPANEFVANFLCSN